MCESLPFEERRYERLDERPDERPDERILEKPKERPVVQSDYCYKFFIAIIIMALIYKIFK